MTTTPTNSGTCKTCGKPLPDGAKYIYCQNNKCAVLWHYYNKRINKECLRCKTPFNVPYCYKKQKYCSHSCSAKHKSELAQARQQEDLIFKAEYLAHRVCPVCQNHIPSDSLLVTYCGEKCRRIRNNIVRQKKQYAKI